MTTGYGTPGMEIGGGRALREDWVPVAGYENFYEVSNLGRVRSNVLRAGLVLKPVSDRYGYLTVRLFRDEARRYRIHRLVCEAFSGEAPEGTECAHLDGNKANNRADNLAWVTRSENSRHKLAHGTHQDQRGEKHPRAKLTAEQVQAIRASEASSRGLARELGVNESAVRKIRGGQRWKI